MEHIQAAAGSDDLAQSVPSTGTRWPWPQVFPTEQSQAQSHCVASHLLLLLCEPLKPLSSLPFPRYLLLGRAGKEPSGAPWGRVPILGLGRCQRLPNLACRSPEWVEGEREGPWPRVLGSAREETGLPQLGFLFLDASVSAWLSRRPPPAPK